jgi:tetratricopeptide (TPR) repeat protein
VPDQRPHWNAHFAREQARYHDGEARLPGTADPDARQRQLTRLGNAAGGAGLALLMAGRREEAGSWFDRAATRYRESFADAPPESWGRPIGAMKARILAGDWHGAADDARWALAAGAPEAVSPIGRYAAALACLALEDDEAARSHADALLERDDFPRDVGDALAAIAAHDGAAYATAVTAVTASFEARDEYLEDVPVADTAIVLQALAARRGLEAPLASPLLPSS